MYQVSALQAMHRRFGDAVPMVLDGSRRVGRSKMRVLGTSLAYLRLALRGASGRL